MSTLCNTGRTTDIVVHSHDSAVPPPEDVLPGIRSDAAHGTRSAKASLPGYRRGYSLIEVAFAIAVLLVAGLATAAGRYHGALLTRRAAVHTTAVRLASYFLYSWAGSGGHSAYSTYEVDDPTDYDPLDPNDYDPLDVDPIRFAAGWSVEFNAAGPPAPDGFAPLDAMARPNYRLVIDDVNYSITLSYRDVQDHPRLLHVCVAWMPDYGPWNAAKPYKSVQLSMYAPG